MPQHNATPRAASLPVVDGAQATRRDLLKASVLLPSLFVLPSRAESAPALVPYADRPDGFSLSVPDGWLNSEGAISGNASFQGASGSRRTLAFYPKDRLARDLNVTVTVTNVGADYVALGSFGKVDAFGESLVNSMDRSYLQRAPGWARGKEPLQIAKLVDAKERNSMYFVEYTVEKEPEAARHLLSLLAMGYNGKYNRLYTVTAQCLESEVSADRPLLESILGSFIPPVSKQR